MQFKISTRKKQEIIDITGSVAEAVKDIKSGLCNVYVPHATAAVIINENYDPNICTDLLNALNKAFPDDCGYLHDKVDGNAGAHIKASVLGPSETVHVKDGKLVLGTWQSIMLVDLDGPRERTVNIEIVGS